MSLSFVKDKTSYYSCFIIDWSVPIKLIDKVKGDKLAVAGYMAVD